MELILRKQLEDRVLEDVARDVVFVAGIDRDAGETPALLGLEVLDGEVLAGRLHHDGGSHDLTGFDARLLSDSRKMPSVVPTSTMADTSSRLMEAWLPLGVKTLVISSESSTRG